MFRWPAAADLEVSARRISGWVGSREGWSRFAVAVIAGSLSVLSMAPFFFWPILFLTLPVLVWLIDGATRDQQASDGSKPIARETALRSAKDGWAFAFGYFFFGLFWIGEAFLVEAETFGVLLPFAVTLMPAGLALFWGAATACSSLVWRRGVNRVFVLALALSATEYARGHVFTGFPWNTLGYALTWPVTFMQSASVIGIYGLTLITVVVCASPLVGIAMARRTPSYRHPATIGVTLALVPLTIIYAYGAFRLATAETNFVEGVKLRIVQPATNQRDKWRSDKQSEIFQAHLDLSRTNEAGSKDELNGVTHVIWPEAAMPFLPLSTPRALAAIGDVLPQGTFLVSGALRVTQATDSTDIYRSAPGDRRAYNSLMVFGFTGGLVSLYDKLHLVPFGEYLPFQEALEAVGLQSLTRVRGGFSTGISPRPILSIPGLPPFVPLICYEAIFPAQVIQDAHALDAGMRPGLMINVTNDGWFGNTTGPPQHFHQNRLRAVEEGIPLIRAANNGISGVVDAYGQVVTMLPLNQKGVLDSRLPTKISPPLYALYGNSLFGAIWLCVLLTIVAIRFRAVE
ncbi:MAG: apolipoprotein N-acyltransferase [Pseudomonadota bacterium]